MDAPGVRMLYLPAKLFAWSDRGHPAHDARDYPVVNSGLTFPFPPPKLYNARANGSSAMQFHELRATPLVASPIHSSKSSTKTAATVEALGHFLPSRKLRIRHCPSFLNRLKHYALSEFQQPPAQPGQANPAGLNGGPSSWSRGRTVNGATLPPAGIQAEVLHELAFHYLVQTHRAPEIINCELALHLEVHAQFFAILKVWMKVRCMPSS